VDLGFKSVLQSTFRILQSKIRNVLTPVFLTLGILGNLAHFRHFLFCLLPLYDAS